MFCGVTAAPEIDGSADAELEGVDPRAVVEQLASGAPPYLLDVREPWEWAVSNLAEHGARLIPLGELEERLGEIPEDRAVVVYCRTGQRSEDAADLLRNRFRARDVGASALHVSGECLRRKHA